MLVFSSSSHLCLVPNCLVLSLLLWRTCPFPPPPFDYVNKNSGRSSGQKLLSPLKRTEKSPPLLLSSSLHNHTLTFFSMSFFSFSKSVPPPSKCEKCLASKLSVGQSVNLRGCVHVQHTQNLANPQWFSPK